MRLFKIFTVFLLLPLSVMAAPEVWTGKVAKEFASGTGKKDNPYIIKTAEQFALMAEKHADSLYYKLADDIVLNTGDANDWAKKAPKNKWMVYGDTAKPAKVRLDGDGHSVSGLYVSSDKDYQGLFGAWEGVVENLSVKNSYIKGKNNVGSLAGFWRSVKENFGTFFNVQNISADINVEGSNHVGGIFGAAMCIESDTTNWLDIVSHDFFPFPFLLSCYGFLNVRNVSVSGSIEGDKYVGGLMGMTGASYSYLKVQGIINKASVKGNVSVGGILGVAEFDVPIDSARFSDIANYGTIAGGTIAGGLIGTLYVDRDPQDIHFQNLANIGSVSGEKKVGGIFGTYYSRQYKNQLVYLNGYNAGKIKGDSAVAPLFYDASIYKNYLDSLHMYDFSGESSDFIRQYTDSLGAYFIPDTGSSPVNNGYPLLAYFNRDKIYRYGSGTFDDPYLIKDLHDLRRFEKHAEIVFDSSSRDIRYYRQEADIQLPKEKNNWKPVNGYYLYYDGNKHSISNLNIDVGVNIDSLLEEPEQNISSSICTGRGNDYHRTGTGLFSTLTGSEIKSLTLHDVDIVGCLGVGALLGDDYGRSNNVFIDITVDGSVSGYGGVGGIIGGRADKLFNVTNYADVKGIFNIGGIAGGGDFYYARNYGKITGGSTIGGITYNLDEGGIFSYSFNRGQVTGNSIVGGLIGEFSGSSKRFTEMSSSYNAATVSGNKSVGAIIGCSTKKDTLVVTALYDKSLSDIPAVGCDSIVVQDSILGMDTKSLKSSNALKELGPAFMLDSENENDGYPVFSFFEGDGTENVPYIINSADKLKLLSYLSDKEITYFFSDKNFKVTADIDLKTSSQDPWQSMFASPYYKFTGTFDGDGHTISGIYTDSLDNSGLFSISSGTIKNVGVAKSTIRGIKAGAIVGLNHGNIENCWNENASVSGDTAGGIVGYFEADSTDGFLTHDTASRKIYIDRSYNAGEVNGHAYAGGVAGFMSMTPMVYHAATKEPYNFISIVNSYNVGIVKSDSGSVAGLTSVYGRSSDIRQKTPYTLKNLYNTVDVCSETKAKKCSPTLLFKDTAGTYVNNVFYLGTKDSTIVGTAKSSKEMKSKDFAKLLGDAFAYDSKGVNNGFPILSGMGTFDPDKYDKEQVGIKRQPLVYKALQVSVVGREIHLDHLVDGVNTVLFDLRGKRVWNGTGISATIPVQKPGIYIIRNKFQMAKIVVR